jgi:anti-sigma B factor antagonist
MDVTVVEVDGSLDLSAAPRVHALLAAALDGGGLVVLDLSSVTAVDHAGFGVVAGALLQARQRGGDLRVVAPPGPARDPFEITGTRQVFGVSDTVESAVAP